MLEERLMFLKATTGGLDLKATLSTTTTLYQ